jgi:ADP-heptose:LPS heptosyltransferase
VNILLIRLRSIGDVVFTTPAIRALRRRYPGARLCYLVEPDGAPVVHANPHLDEVLVAPRPSPRTRLLSDLSLARRLRASRYDLAIDFHGGPRSAWLTLASGAPTRIGYDIAGRRWMYTVRVPRARELRPRHSVVNQWDLLVPLGFDPPDPARDPTEMGEDPAAAGSVATKLRRAGIVPGLHDVIVLHVSAGNPFRRWPAASFVDLVARLADSKARRRVVLTSGPSEAEAALRIGLEARSRLGPARADAVVSDVMFDLAELRALLGRAALFIGGDSGPLHVASTTPVPIVGLYGPTLAARSAPWRAPEIATESIELGDLPCRPCDQRRCTPGDFRCLGWIGAGMVADAAEHALERASRTRTPREAPPDASQAD